MGEFPATSVVISTTVYFFFMFVLVTAVISSPVLSDTSVRRTGGDLRYDNQDFQSDNSAQLSTNSTTGFNKVKTAFTVMSKVGTNNISLGEPQEWGWIISFIFFWLPLVLFLMGVYFLMPFAH